MTPEEQIASWRRMIDEVDGQIMSLIRSRREASEEILRIRLENGYEKLYDYKRHDQIRSRYEGLSGLMSLGGAILEASTRNHVKIELDWMRKQLQSDT